MTPDNERLNKYWKYIRAIFADDGLQEADCADLVQETYLRIAKQLSKGVTLPSSDDALKRWLAFHARCKRNDYWRGQFIRSKGKKEDSKRRPRMIEFGSPEPVQTDARGRGLPHWFARAQDSKTKQDELLEEIRTKVGGKPAYAVMLVFQGYRLKDIAQFLKVGVKTVRRYLVKAKEVLEKG